MTRVITYGTFDLLHYGHIRLLERARALGDYLIVGVTADGFDRARGKINVRQTLSERMEAVRSTGLADEVIVEEYEGQKIDDILRFDVDVFAIGSDWRGKFDYLGEWCKVVYLERTQGISSSEIRSSRAPLKLGIFAGSKLAEKYSAQVMHVNGVELSCCGNPNATDSSDDIDARYSRILENSDAVYIASHPSVRAKHVRVALERGKHVLCEPPLAPSSEECLNLLKLADGKGLVVFEALKTAYSTAYHHLLLLVKTGVIGRIVSVEATCTSLSDMQQSDVSLDIKWPSSDAWGPTALLPLLQILGTKYIEMRSVKSSIEGREDFDVYGKIDLVYPSAVGTVVFGKSVKSEGSLIISGTKGYVYVPSPWWKTDYFEIRTEDSADMRRFFYQLDGEGIGYELVSFARAIEMDRRESDHVEREVAVAIADILNRFKSNSGSMAMLEPILLNEV